MTRYDTPPHHSTAPSAGSARPTAVPDEAWADLLVPADPDTDPVLYRVGETRLTDTTGTTAVTFQPGAVDQLTFGAVRSALARRLDLVVTVPKGNHHVASLLAVIVRLLQLGAATQGTPSPVTGPVVHASGRVGLLEQLRSVRVDTVTLAAGLGPKAIRRDGRLRTTSGYVENHDPHRIRADGGALWHLSTRCGWPAVPIEHGCVIVDATSMGIRSVHAAVRWADDNGADSVLVVDDLGSSLGRDTLAQQRSNPAVAINWTQTLIEQAAAHLGRVGVHAPLSTNGLLTTGRVCDLHIVEIGDPDGDAALTAAVRALATTLEHAPPGELPAPLAASRALVNGLSRLASTRLTFDNYASTHRRAKSLRTAMIAVRDASPSTFAGTWHGVGQAGWASVKETALAAYEHLDGHASRFDTVRFTIERAVDEHPHATVLLRAPTRIAADALLTDLLGVNHPGVNADPTGPRPPGTVIVVAHSERHPWDTTDEVVDVLAAPDLFDPRHLLSSEATSGRYAVAWPHQTRRLARVFAAACDDADAGNEHAFRSLALGRYPDGPRPQVQRVRAAPSRLSEDSGHTASIMEADTTLLTGDLPEVGLDEEYEQLGSDSDDDSASFEEEHVDATDTVTVVPVFVHPGQVWLADVDDAGVVRGDEYRTLPVTQLARDDTVLIPAPGTYGDLFTRLVAARHQHSDVATLDIGLRSWRRGLDAAVAACDGNVAEFARRLHERGVDLTYAAIRLWVEGRTIAPARAQDIEVVGHVGGNQFLIDNARRVAAIAQEVRVVHRQLGRLVHRAVEEALTGGEHLRTLAEVVDDLEIGEVLDEFEQRTVTSVGTPMDVPRAIAGQLRDQP